MQGNRKGESASHRCGICGQAGGPLAQGPTNGIGSCILRPSKEPTLNVIKVLPPTAISACVLIPGPHRSEGTPQSPHSPQRCGLGPRGPPGGGGGQTLVTDKTCS